MLLAEYALTPEVFHLENYDDQESCKQNLRYIRETLIHWSIVRDLRSGAWSRKVLDKEASLHPKGKELLKKIKQYNRLFHFPPVIANSPASETEWCEEALGSHKSIPLNGIIVTNRIIDQFRKNDIVSEIGKVENKTWWRKHQDTEIRIRKCRDDYQQALSTIFRYANSIMFVDPYLDPRKPEYGDFFELILENLRDRSLQPQIEFHRKWTENDDWRSIFVRELSNKYRDAGLKCQVFIWDDFHDRFVISNLLGISTSQGFDTTSDSKKIAIWSRLSTATRDHVQREFDKASTLHKLRVHFEL